MSAREARDSRPRTRRWVAVLLIVLAAVAIGLYSAQDQRTLQVRSAMAADDPRFPAYAASLAGVALTYSADVQVLQNGDGIYPEMLESIAHARRRIGFETYNYNRGEAGDKFTEALIATRKRGVEVRVVLDAFGASVPPPRLKERFTEAGVELGVFNPVGLWGIESTTFRTHRKLLAVDGAVGFTGGAGVADHWLGHAQDADHWRDTHFKLTGPIVREVESCFYENWIQAGGDDPPELAAVNGTRTAALPSLAVCSNPTGTVTNAKLLFLYSIAAARRTIDIQSPYFMPDSSFRLVLKEARDRGVRIRVLSDGDISDARSVKRASRNKYDSLLQTGLQIFEYQPTMMHTKVMVVDGIWSVFGSPNLDNRSLELSDEITVAVADRRLASTLTGAFNADLTRAKEIRLEEWRRRPLHQRVRERLWALFSEIF